MKTYRETFLTMALAVLALGAGVTLPLFFGDAVPQIAGGNIWDTVLGDARQLVSASFMEKADQYYHGGVTAENCDEGLTTLSDKSGAQYEDSLAKADHDHDHDHDHPHHHHEHHHHATPTMCAYDPWHWINSRVHAQEHRHMKHAEAQELLPWLWAACRSAPQNIRAFESSAYVLEKMLERPSDAADLLREGIAQNTGSGELEFALGEVLLRSLKDKAQAEQAFTAAVEKLQPADGEAGDDTRRLKGRACFYVGYLALQRGDHDRAAAALATAEATDPAGVGARGLRKLLERAAD